MSLNRRYTSPALEKSINRLKFNQFDVKDDGDCLFHSLEFIFNAMGKTEGTALDIRLKVINFIQTDKVMYDYIIMMGGYEDEIQLKNELVMLSEPRIYEVPLFDLFPIVISTLFHIQLSIYPWQSNDEGDVGITLKDEETYTGLNGYDETIRLLYVNGIHYKPILTGKIAKAHFDRLADLENQRFQDTLILIRKEMKEKEMKKQERELKKQQKLNKKGIVA
jgi:hypothetical protein